MTTIALDLDDRMRLAVTDFHMTLDKIIAEEGMDEGLRVDDGDVYAVANLWTTGDQEGMTPCRFDPHDGTCLAHADAHTLAGAIVASMMARFGGEA